VTAAESLGIFVFEALHVWPAQLAVREWWQLQERHRSIAAVLACRKGGICARLASEDVTGAASRTRTARWSFGS
jgi:hypothetical protein